MSTTNSELKEVPSNPVSKVKRRRETYKKYNQSSKGLERKKRYKIKQQLKRQVSVSQRAQQFTIMCDDAAVFSISQADLTKNPNAVQEFWHSVLAAAHSFCQDPDLGNNIQTALRSFYEDEEEDEEDQQNSSSSPSKSSSSSSSLGTNNVSHEIIVPSSSGGTNRSTNPVAFPLPSYSHLTSAFPPFAPQPENRRPSLSYMFTPMDDHYKTIFSPAFELVTPRSSFSLSNSSSSNGMVSNFLENSDKTATWRSSNSPIQPQIQQLQQAQQQIQQQTQQLQQQLQQTQQLQQPLQTNQQPSRNLQALLSSQILNQQTNSSPPSQLANSSGQSLSSSNSSGISPNPKYFYSSTSPTQKPSYFLPTSALYGFGSHLPPPQSFLPSLRSQQTTSLSSNPQSPSTIVQILNPPSTQDKSSDT